MYLSDEQKREWLRQAVINDMRDLIKRKDQLKDISDTAKEVWTALLEADEWQIVKGPPPPDKNWKEPEEIWKMKPTVVTKPYESET